MLRAIIREADCVGCAKCLPACPVDAIIGAPKFLHSVLSEECIGCKLCIAPCPMDCIEMVELPEEAIPEKVDRAMRAKIRYQNRKMRLLQAEQPKLFYDKTDPNYRQKMKEDINAAVNRVMMKKQRQAKDEVLNEQTKMHRTLSKISE